MSLRSSERGLKFPLPLQVQHLYTVAPFVGAWIEISKYSERLFIVLVAPFVGAWIEMGTPTTVAGMALSLRSSERGLK